MNVYQTSEVDWFMAESPEQARQLAAELYGGDADDYCVLPLDEITALSADELNRLQYTDDDTKTTRSFAEELALRIAANEPAGMFATSEY